MAQGQEAEPVALHPGPSRSRSRRPPRNRRRRLTRRAHDTNLRHQTASDPDAGDAGSSSGSSVIPRGCICGDDRRLDDAIARIAATHHGVFAADHLDRTWRSRRAPAGASRLPDAGSSCYDSVYRVAGAPHHVARRRCSQPAGRAAPERLASHRRPLRSRSYRAARRSLGRDHVPPLAARPPRRSRRPREPSARRRRPRRWSTGFPARPSSGRSSISPRQVDRGMLDASIDAALRRELTSPRRAPAHSRATRDARAAGGSRCSATAGRAHARIDALPESAPERLLATSLDPPGLPAPVHCSTWCATLTAAFVARVDLAYPDGKIVIEYDSFEQHIGKLALVRDSARRNALADLGFTVLTATAADLATTRSRSAR